MCAVQGQCIGARTVSTVYALQYYYFEEDLVHVAMRRETVYEARLRGLGAGGKQGVEKGGCGSVEKKDYATIKGWDETGVCSGISVVVLLFREMKYDRPCLKSFSLLGEFILKLRFTTAHTHPHSLLPLVS